MHKFAFLVFPFLLILFVYRAWFSPGLVFAFDFHFYFPQMISVASPQIYSWGWNIVVDGLHQTLVPFMWIAPLLNFPIFIGKMFGLDWNIIERVFYLYPLLIFLIVSPIVLIKFLFPRINPFFYLISSIVFSLNTYILMTVGGGQIYIAMSYSILPVVLWSFLRIWEEKKLLWSVSAGLLLALQAILEIRIAVISLFIVFCFFIFNIVKNLSQKSKIDFFANSLRVFFLPGVIVALIHSFWLLPLIVFRIQPFDSLGAAHTSSQAVQYLSFTDFSKTLSLLSPYYPENIFGKVSFMKPEFLAIPILAFSSLLFIKKGKNKENFYILFFSLLGIIGAFLAKGAKEPFGNLYLFLFDLPGFNLFRDSSKWYAILGVSYSVLITYSIFNIYDWLKKKNLHLPLVRRKTRIFNFQNLFIFALLIYLLLLLRPTLTGSLSGAFKITQIPSDYIKLTENLVEDSSFSRVLWLPKYYKFGYQDYLHPSLSYNAITKKNSLLENLEILKEKNTLDTLADMSVGYIVVPEGLPEVFSEEDLKKRDEAVLLLRSFRELKELNGFESIRVFKVGDHKDHFWSNSNNLNVSFQYLNPTLYKVNVKNAEKGNVLVFVEKYDNNWEARGENYVLSSQRIDNLYNGFKLSRSGSYELQVYYKPQRFVEIGQVISMATLIASLVILVKLKKSKIR